MKYMREQKCPAIENQPRRLPSNKISGKGDKSEKMAGKKFQRINRKQFLERKREKNHPLKRTQ